jgi:heptosyltransferase-2
MTNSVRGMADSATLIVRIPNWLGDAVMALPAMAAVRRATSGSLILAGPPSIVPLFEEETDAAPDGILPIEKDREVERLRARGAGTILLLPNSFRSAWIASRSGIPERWGYRTAGRGLLLTRSPRAPRGTMHQRRYYLELMRALEIPAADDVPRMRARASSRERADTMLKNAGVSLGDVLVGFAPGAAYGQAKRWPPDRVAAVIERLASRGVRAVLLGADADRATARAIESALPAGVRPIDLVGRTSLRELAGVLARCAAFVSNDSGAMHVAAALGVPVTAIFGPTNERETSPEGPAAHDIVLRDVFCRPCMLRDCPIDHRCMKRIGVDDVIASVEKHLAVRSSGSLSGS